MIESLIDQDLQYVCSVIPLKNVIGYFQKNSKEFSKLQRGFRAKSLDAAQKERILFRGVKNKNRFVCDFIDKLITDLLIQIYECIKQETEKTKDEKQATIHTLVDSFFAGNVVLYFRLASITESEEYIASVQAMVYSSKQAQIEEKDAKIKHLQKQIDCANEGISNCLDKNAELIRELSKERGRACALAERKDKIEKQFSELKLQSDTSIEILSNELRKTESINKKFKVAIQSLKKEVSEKDARITQLNSELEEASLRMQVAATVDISAQSIPLKPADIDYFKEYLGYNFKTFGVAAGKNLLANYLSKVLFTGRPIAVERLFVHNFANCLSNTLVKGREVKVLTYSVGINAEVISKFLSEDCRIVVLDNFIGNMNETLLLPLLDKHKEKIILLGVAYEKTLKYVSDEFWVYVKHLDLSHTCGFLSEPENMEDPSEFEELPFYPTTAAVDAHMSKILMEIAEELGMAKKYAEHRAREVENEEIFFGMLLFELMPFVKYSLEKNPIASERLHKHIKISRSTYVELVKEWYSA